MSPMYTESNIVDVRFGDNVRIIKPVNIYKCSIGDNCFVGPFVEIQCGVTIGNYVKIQSHSFICDMVLIGDNCFIGHGVMFINDTFASGRPAGGNKELWSRTIINSNVSIGSNSTILPVEICSNVVIGAGSVVTKDITSPGIYAGNPASLLRSLSA
tara:strand:+ start:841 stop:1308 length:468 start_codon:yes stop_codon:yes gene_type:complete